MFDNVQNGYWRIHAKENLFAQCKGSANLLQSLFITACFQQGISYSPYTTLSNTACMSGQHGQLMSWCRNVAQHGVQVGSWSREQLPGQTGYQLQHHNTTTLQWPPPTQWTNNTTPLLLWLHHWAGGRGEWWSPVLGHIFSSPSNVWMCMCNMLPMLPCQR